MHKFVSLNGEMILATDARTAALSSAALYGRGIFTTIAVRKGEPFLWQKHWRRLNENARITGIDTSGFPEESVLPRLTAILKQNAVSNGRARLTFFDESPSAVWPAETLQRTTLLITTGDLRPVPDNLRLGISPFRLNSASPLAGVKSCNYLEKTLALDEAKQRGFDEAVQFNERGEIASACMANIFWLNDGKLFTPGLKTGCLAGTTREFVVENLECTEIEAGIETVQNTDAIFLTSAGIGVVQVAEFNEKKLYEANHPICDLIRITGD